MIKLPNIHTERLLLRPIHRQDAPDIFEYAKLSKVGPAAGWMPHKSIKETFAFIDYVLSKKRDNQPGIWVIVLEASMKVIGTIEIHSYVGYKGELGFVLHPHYWNQGYITEASLAVMMYAFETLKLSRLEYCHFLDNVASQRVREKLGFKEEGIKRLGFKHENGKIMDEMVASYTIEDYLSDKSKVFLPLRDKIRFYTP